MNREPVQPSMIDAPPTGNATRRRQGLTMAVTAGLLAVSGAFAVQTNLYYVNTANGVNAAPPFLSWATAATNVQEAVNLAEAAVDIANGILCEVVVTDGVHVVSAAVTLSAPIRLRSRSGDPTTTALSGSYPANQHRVMNLLGDAWVSGFTISNGYAYGAAPTNYGGGVYMSTNTLGKGGLLADCRVIRNQARKAPSSGIQGYGCGIYLQAGTVSNCLIQSNTSDLGLGGGVFVLAGGRVLDCRILDNHVATGSTTYGAGIYFYYGGYASNCLVARNTSRHAGGIYMFRGGEMVGSCISNNSAGNGKGVYLAYGGTLRNSVVEFNGSGYTTGSGGGIFIDRTGALVDGCIVRYNTAGSTGGISCDRSTVRNTLVYGNTASSGGAGGMSATAFDNTVIENTTIVRNKCATFAGGLLIAVASTRPYGGVMRNLIVMDNQAGSGSNNVALVPYSGYDIANNNAFVYSCTEPAIPGTGNSDADPRFRDAGSGYGTTAVAGDWRLRPSSTCRDTGLFQTWMSTAFDVRGYPRILPQGDGVVDKGAYENIPDPGATLLYIR
jgi:hypothetical protein